MPRDPRDAKGRGKVRLARARAANQHDIVCVLGKGQISKPRDQGLVNGGCDNNAFRVLLPEPFGPAKTANAEYA